MGLFTEPLNIELWLMTLLAACCRLVNVAVPSSAAGCRLINVNSSIRLQLDPTELLFFGCFNCCRISSPVFNRLLPSCCYFRFNSSYQKRPVPFSPKQNDSVSSPVGGQQQQQQPPVKRHKEDTGNSANSVATSQQQQQLILPALQTTANGSNSLVTSAAVAAVPGTAVTTQGELRLLQLCLVQMSPYKAS